MTPQQVQELLVQLPRVKRKGDRARPAWYVDDRLVARLEDAETLTVRCDFALREELVDAFPETFGVTPAMEGHRKVQVDLRRGDPTAIERSLRAAHELQRKA